VSDSTITAYLPLLGIVLGAVIAGVFNVVRGRQGDSSSKAPTVEAIWKRLDKIDRQLRLEREGRYTLLRVFRAYVSRVQQGGDIALTTEEQRALADTEMPPPESDEEN
jgi:hypothetical protein